MGVKREWKGARPRRGVVGDVRKRRVTQDACLPGGKDDQKEDIASVEKTNGPRIDNQLFKEKQWRKEYKRKEEKDLQNFDLLF
jgi:hypothetical protein